MRPFELQSATRTKRRGARTAAVMTAGAAVAVAACSAPSSHTASPTPATSTHATPMPTVARDRLDSILLTPQEANTLLGSSSMETSVAINHETYTKNLPTVSNPDCLSTVGIILDPVYQGSGYTALSTDILLDSKHQLSQAVASFPSADQALAFVEDLAGKWKACAGQTITAQTIPTAGGISSEGQYTLGSLVGDVPTIALSQNGASGDCQRALSAVSNLVIDVEACSSPLTDQGRQIADKMAGKATR
jgi:PknH-like extracellular domain